MGTAVTHIQRRVWKLLTQAPDVDCRTYASYMNAKVCDIVWGPKVLGRICEGWIVCISWR